MEIIDSQVVQPEPTIEWPESMGADEKHAAEVEMVLAQMDAAGVTNAVISAREYGGFAAKAIEQHPNVFAACLGVNPDMPDVVDVVTNLRRHSRDIFSPGWLGIRVVISWPPDAQGIERLAAGDFEPIFDAAERNQIPTCVFLSGDLQEAFLIAKNHPDMILIVDHFGMKAPPMMRNDHPPFRQLELLLNLATFPNVSVKFSGAPALSEQRYPFKDLWPSLHKVVEAFGPERLMWGADPSRCRGLHSYSEGVNYLRYSDELSESDKELMFGATLRRIMRWPRRP